MNDQHPANDLVTRVTVASLVTAHAEIAIMRATAIRALMGTGATHREAVAAVDEEIARAFRGLVAERLAEAIRLLRPYAIRAAAALRELGDAVRQHTASAQDRAA